MNDKTVINMSANKKPKVTIKDIAKLAGVSTTSVSFAFNDPNRIGKETVQKILEVADELGYVPNPIARSMTTGKTGTLGILLPQPLHEMLSNPFLLDFLEGVGETCTADGYSLMLVPPLQGSIKRAIEYAAVDGFITLGLESEKSTMVLIRQRGVPFVTVDSDPVEGVPAVNIDDGIGAESVMQYILDAGHRKIAIVGIRSGKEGRYQEYVGTLRNRLDGYERALKSKGMDFSSPDVQLIESDSTTLSGGRAIFTELRKAKKQPTAIISMSDIVAVGFIEQAKIDGFEIPEKYSISGFDDLSIARLISPSLTTVAQPIRLKGKTAADILVQLIQGEDVPPITILNTELIVRESVKIIH
jgi:alanine racemase